MKVIWSPNALDQVIKVAEYIALDNSMAAQKWIDEVFDKAKQLESFPFSGRLLPELPNSIYRELVHGNYGIIYKIKAASIEILTVRNFRQILNVSELE